MRSYLTSIAFILFLAFSLSGFSQKGPGSGSAPATCPLYVPKAFTPNGDDLNETFLIRVSESCQIESYSITIFDRWGQVVYESNSLLESQAWNGKIRGSDARPGVYMYKITAKLLPVNSPTGKSEVKNLQGSLVLLR